MKGYIFSIGLFIATASAQVDTVWKTFTVGPWMNISSNSISIAEIQTSVVFKFIGIPAFCSATRLGDFDLIKLNPIPGRYAWERHEGYQCELLYHVINPFKYEINTSFGKRYIMDVVGGEMTGPGGMYVNLNVKIYPNNTTSLSLFLNQRNISEGGEAYLLNGRPVRDEELKGFKKYVLKRKVNR